MNKKIIFLVFLIVTASVILPAMDVTDFWRYPELAERDTLFAGVFAASLAFSVSDITDFRFKTFFPEFYADYILPVGLPFSFGLSLKPMTPGVLGLGLRPAYHINFNVPFLDVYIMYPITFDITNDFLILEFGPRAGVRVKAINFVCINVETGFMAKTINFGLSFKLN